MNKLDVYKQIIEDILRSDMSEEEVLLHMVVFHTHSLVLRSNVSVDDVQPTSGEHRIRLAPLTRTHLAELVSAFWKRNEQRGEMAFWLSLYGRLTPYELFEDIPTSMLDKAVATRESISKHDLIERLIEE